MNVTENNKDDVVAHGTILYDKSQSFQESISEVEFMFTPRHGTILHDITNDQSLDNKSKRASNSNPAKTLTSTRKISGHAICTWKYTRDVPIHLNHVKKKQKISNDENNNRAESAVGKIVEHNHQTVTAVETEVTDPNAVLSAHLISPTNAYSSLNDTHTWSNVLT